MVLNKVPRGVTETLESIQPTRGIVFLGGANFVMHKCEL